MIRLILARILSVVLLADYRCTLQRPISDVKEGIYLAIHQQTIRIRSQNSAI